MFKIEIMISQHLFSEISKYWQTVLTILKLTLKVHTNVFNYTVSLTQDNNYFLIISENWVAILQCKQELRFALFKSLKYTIQYKFIIKSPRIEHFKFKLIHLFTPTNHNASLVLFRELLLLARPIYII